MAERKALAQLLAATALWGTLFSVGKLLSAQLPPLAVTLLRYGLATAVILPLALPQLRRIPRADLPALAAAGLLSSVVFNSLVFWGLQHAPAGDAVIAPAISPILVAAFGILFLGQRPSPQRLVSLGIAAAGLALVFSASLSGAGSSTRAFGDLLHLGAAVGWAGYLLLTARLSKRHSPLVLTAATTIAGTLGGLPLALLEGGLPRLATLSATGWLQVLYVSLLGSVAAFLLWSRGVAGVGAERAALFMNLVPIFGLVGSVVFLREQLGLVQIAGIALVIGGVASSTLAARRSALPAAAAAEA